ncbi:MAG: hypothetical protein R2801_00210 [Chitinophagales bacterium]
MTPLIMVNGTQVALSQTNFTNANANGNTGNVSYLANLAVGDVVSLDLIVTKSASSTFRILDAQLFVTQQDCGLRLIHRHRYLVCGWGSVQYC